MLQYCQRRTCKATLAAPSDLRCLSSLSNPRHLPLELSLSLVEEVPAIRCQSLSQSFIHRLNLLLAVGRHDTVLQSALPLVLDTLYLVVRAKDMINLLILLVSVVAGFVTR